MQEKYEIFNVMKSGVQVIDRDFRYQFLNIELLRHIQKSPEEVIGIPMSKVFPGIEQTEIYQAIAETFETGRSRRILNEFVLVDGTIRHYDLRLSSVPDGVLIISDEIREEEDIEFYIESAWRHWKEQAESYQQTLRKVLDSSFAGVQYFKSIRCESGDIVDFEYIFSNEAACEIIGHTEEFLVGRRLLEVLPGHSANR
ncbi:MAG: PAS domain-containing protein, partial [Leptospiraceae bacterium]|nr:PAS domain-containing protein [Leptospiraceae bacterium]